MSLRLKIFSTFVIVTLATVTLVTVLVSRRFTSQAVADLALNIQNAEEIFGTVIALEFERLLDETSRLSEDPRLLASLSTLDVATISETVSNFGQSNDAPLLLILSPEEKYLTGWGLPSAAYSTVSSEAVITDAANGFEAGDYWKVGTDILMVSASPVDARTRRLGIVVLGHKLDGLVLGNLQKLTNSHFALSVDGTISHETGGVASELFAESISRLRPATPPTEFRTGESRYIGSRMDILNATQKTLGSLTIYQSLDQALMALDPIRSSIYLIALVSIAISLLASYQIARGVTRPVESLAVKINQFGTGNYDEPVEIYSNDEVGMLAASFEEMRQSLIIAQNKLVKSERLSTLGQMANGIIHDFKQPMTSIQGYTELLSLPGIEVEKRSMYADRIFASIQQMNAMVRDLLDFSRGEASLNLETVDFNCVVDAAVDTFSERFSDNTIALKFIPGELPQLSVDRLRMQRVIENLIGNASDAIGDSGTITIRTDASPLSIELVVSDTGSGIPAKLHDTLFDPFVTMGKATGMGLGLAITKNIVEEHGGAITFETNADVGTEFRISLPVSKT